MLSMGAAEPKQGCALGSFKDADFKFGVHAFSPRSHPLPPSLPPCDLLQERV